jgi:flagellar motility protein MotE (MotC chaperone)
MAEKRLTREQARELYDDLHRAMSQMMNKPGVKLPASASEKQGNAQVAKEIAQAIRSGLRADGGDESKSRSPMRTAGPVRQSPSQRARGAGQLRGQRLAVSCVALFCCAKVVVSGLEAADIGRVEVAQASLQMPVQAVAKGPQWSKEEVKVLTALDHRRAELEERSARLDQREVELVARDSDVAGRLTELRELTERLKLDREKGDKQRNTQLEQLANVYGSMNPPEAAHLLEQLEVSVALGLIERMPEKRMGQILALMNAQRALELTNLLSSRTGGRS